MTMTDGGGDLHEVVQHIREQSYPSVPIELVDSILDTEAAYVDDRSTALRRIREFVDQYVSKAG
jgi:hypothetical protein